MLLLNLCRTFTNPSPGERNVLEGVSSLISGIICSLKLGTIRHYSFNVCVRRDVFNFLFEDKGSRVCHRRGKIIDILMMMIFYMLIIVMSVFVLYSQCICIVMLSLLS